MSNTFHSIEGGLPNLVGGRWYNKKGVEYTSAPEGWTKVEVKLQFKDMERKKEIAKWIRVNSKKDCLFPRTILLLGVYIFEDAREAMMFKLKWG